MKAAVASATRLRRPSAAQRAAALSKKVRRGESVIKDILDATRDELARVGYEALRIDDVAARAEVNKTTIYRRWPTKFELVHETLRVIFDEHGEPVLTGCLRDDLLAMARAMLDFLRSPVGHVLVRMAHVEKIESDFRRIIDSVRCDKESLARGILASAQARGEISATLDPELFLSMLVGGIHHRIFILRIPPSRIDLEAHVDLLLHGASSAPARAKLPPRERRTR